MQNFIKLIRKGPKGTSSIFYFNINMISFISPHGGYIILSEYGDFDLKDNEMEELLKLIDDRCNVLIGK